jgi:hypothetical protein
MLQPPACSITNLTFHLTIPAANYVCSSLASECTFAEELPPRWQQRCRALETPRLRIGSSAAMLWEHLRLQQRLLRLVATPSPDGSSTVVP